MGFQKVKEYFYQDPSGRSILRVDRMEAEDGSGTKKFLMYQSKEGDKWTSGKPDEVITPYAFGLWKNISPEETLFLVEGEKCADALIWGGVAATTTPGGAQSWQSSFTRFFSRIQVIILHDADQSGIEYALKAFTDLKKVCSSIKILSLPGLKPGSGEDVVDWLEHGHDLTELRKLVETAACATTQENSPFFEPMPDIVCLDQIESKEVIWVLRPHIPSSQITLVDGEAGSGKTWFTLAIASAITRGKSVCGFPIEQSGNVLFLGEDEASYVLKPRLEKLGADFGKFHVLDESAILSDVNLDALETYIRRHQPCLVVIDHLGLFIDSSLDLYRANEMGPFMARLKQLAVRYRCAIIGLRHIRKSGAERAANLGIGSTALQGAARSVLFVGQDPQNPSQYAAIHTKSNLAPKGQALGFGFQNNCFSWIGVSNLTIGHLLQSDTKAKQSELGDAKEFLLEKLNAGSRLQTELMEEALALSFSAQTIRRAKNDLNLKSKKVGSGPWYWSLSEAPKDRDE